MIKDFESISHTADLQIRVYGKTLKELFKNAIIAMFQSIGPKAKNENCKYKEDRLICSDFTQEHKIELSSSNYEFLLIDFLSEALYLSDVHNEAYLDVDIYELNETKILATLKGIKITGFEIEIKAVTYNNLNIKKEDSYYVTDIVFDI